MKQIKNSLSIGSTKTAILSAILAGCIASVAQALPITYYSGTASITSPGFADLQENGLVLRDGATPGRFAVYNGYITTGLYNGTNGYWDGPGLNSSTAAAAAVGLYALGILDNGVAGFSQLLGSPVLSTDILIRMTYFGDIDLNGVVDGVDLSLVNGGFGINNGGWLGGDVDYNTFTDAGDLSLVNGNFGLPQLPGGPTGFASGGEKPPGSVVPEPTSLVLLAVGALGVLHRRRRISPRP